MSNAYHFDWPAASITSCVVSVPAPVSPNAVGHWSFAALATTQGETSEEPVRLAATKLRG